MLDLEEYTRDTFASLATCVDLADFRTQKLVVHLTPAAWRDENREAKREGDRWYKRVNRHTINARRRSDWSANAEACRAQGRLYCETYRDRHLAKQKVYRDTLTEEKRAKRRARQNAWKKAKRLARAN